MKHTFYVEDMLGDCTVPVEVQYVAEHVSGGVYDVSIISAKHPDGTNYPLGDAEREGWEIELASARKRSKTKGDKELASD